MENNNHNAKAVEDEHIKNYIDLHPPILVRNNALGIPMLQTIFIVPIALFPPFSHIFAFVLLTPFVFFLLWAVWIMLNPVKRQKQYILYTGSGFAILSLTLLIACQKIAYLMLELRSPLYAICTFLGYAIVYILAARFHFKAVYSGLYDRLKRKRHKSAKKYFGIISLFTGIGILFGNIAVYQTTDSPNANLTIYAMLCMAMSFISIIASHNIHKFYLVRKHSDLVHLYEATPKKKTKKRGIEK
jgi:hypothetical protein